MPLYMPSSMPRPLVTPDFERLNGSALGKRQRRALLDMRDVVFVTLRV
ncbi:MAG: hypothetical protein PUK59_02800 [Actinomycetaceae bacterium]|nr:hypothetical protein [Actinomycetaceae bacterium]MDY5855370.1 hypothetical protein [Arcanobacterium sp.]